MKLFGLPCVFTLFVIVASFLYRAEVADGANEFRKCYNTSIEMHCFTVQYDANNGLLTTLNDNARRRCNSLNSTLIIIKDEETNNIVQNYTSDPNNPILYQYVWTDAYRINDYNNTYYTLHWVNAKLPNLAASEVGYNTYIWDGSYYTTTLESRSDNGKTQFYLTAKRPQDNYNYLCEYSVSRCSSNGSNVLQLSDRCYIPFIASVPWYEARNRCLKDGGDLASFANVTSINFTSWLGSDPNVRFWIGLRFSWYIWKDTGQDVKFSNLKLNQDYTDLQCLVVCSGCDPSFTWLSKDCSLTDTIYVPVVCHSVTPLISSAISMVKITTSPSMQTSAASRNEFIPTEDNQQVTPASSRSADGSVGIGLGVGLGVPLVISIILTVFFAVKSKRLETRQEQQVSNNRIALGEVHETPVVQVSDSANDQYQQLNRNLDNSSAAMYDKLRAVDTNQNYEEFSSSGI